MLAVLRVGSKLEDQLDIKAKISWDEGKIEGECGECIDEFTLKLRRVTQEPEEEPKDEKDD